jgi:Putative auto-transporter adhesin, head GIN domain
MKVKAVTIGLLVIIGGLLLSACGDLVGSGKMVTEDRAVGSFSELEISGLGKAIITQGNTPALRIEADDNVIGNIESKVEGNRLKINFKNGMNLTTGRITYYVTVPNLTVIDTSGAASIEADALNTSSLRVKVSGAGDLRLGGKAESLDLQMSGAGNLKAEKFEVASAKVSISGAGSADVTVSGKLDVSLSGVGSVTYGGNPQISQNISGLGSVKKR